MKRYRNAARIFEEAALAYREAYLADECFKAIENATVMLVRTGPDFEARKEIVRLNTLAGQIAEEASEYMKAADFYFIAADFTNDYEERTSLFVKAADALENQADICELEEDFALTVRLLKKVGRIYFTSGDKELAERIYQRAIRIAKKWAESDIAKKNFAGAGAAFAEAAQILLMRENQIEAARLLMEAGKYYEEAGLYEMAGNTYDAAAELFKAERNTTSWRKAIVKAADAYLAMEGAPESSAPLLVKTAEMLQSIGLNVKAKWAFKKAGEMFAELAREAEENNDDETQNKYRRYQAMCLKNWGDRDVATSLYEKVVEYYYKQAKNKEKEGETELQAMHLVDAAEILLEMDREQEGRDLIEKANQLYRQLGEKADEQLAYERSSRYYLRAGELARKLDDTKLMISLYQTACERAEVVAAEFEKKNVKELAAVWWRNAAEAALKSQKHNLISKAIDFLTKAVEDFKEIGAFSEAFVDLFKLFVIFFENRPEEKSKILKIVDELQELSISAKDEQLKRLMVILRPLVRDEYVEAGMAFQEHKNSLGDFAEQLQKILPEKQKQTE